MPAIGIRPTIDGPRLGVRESLEDQTMNMAKVAAAWNLFCTADAEGADFRACANFGPIYGKY